MKKVIWLKTKLLKLFVLAVVGLVVLPLMVQSVLAATTKADRTVPVYDIPTNDAVNSLVMSFDINVGNDVGAAGVGAGLSIAGAISSVPADWNSEGVYSVKFRDVGAGGIGAGDGVWDPSYDWIGIDNDTGNYGAGDTTIAGHTPPLVAPLTNVKPWSTMKFYDAASGGPWDVDHDWIGIDADSNGYYLDKLTAITADLLLGDPDTINALEDVHDVKFWLDSNNNHSYDAGSETLLATALTSDAYDSGGSGWHTLIAPEKQALAAGSNTIFVTMTLNDNTSPTHASNGELVKMNIPLFVDSNSNKTLDEGDRGMFLVSRVLGNVVNSVSMTVDTHIPTLDSIVVDDDLKLGGSSDVTFTFSEPVTNFASGDVTVENASITSGPTPVGDGTVWTATISPNGGSIDDTTNQITVHMEGVDNLMLDSFNSPVVGNHGSSSSHTYSNNYVVDTTPPTVVISNNGVLTNGVINIANREVTYTFQFRDGGADENVTDFDETDVVVAGGTKGTFTKVNDSRYTLVVDARDDSTTDLTVNVAAGAAHDLYGNDSVVATQSTLSVDTLAPVITISDNAVLTNGAINIAHHEVIYTFDFSEAVTDFDATDVTVTGGEAVGWSFTQVNPSKYTLGVDAYHDSTADLKVSVAAGAAHDAHSNGNILTESTHSVDTVAPTITISDDRDGIANRNDGAVTYTFEFSENVTSFAKGDIGVTGGTAGDFTTVSASEYTLVVTPTDLSTANIAVSIAGGLASDPHGNFNVSASNSAQTVDTVPPTLTVTMVSNSFIIGHVTTMVTFTFSEVPTGFDSSDITVDNGTLGEITGTLDPLVKTATFTADSDIEDHTNLVSVDGDGWTDAAGNHPVAAKSDSPSYSIDTLAPTLTITIDDTAIKSGDTPTVTFNFSEQVTGFDADSITLHENGELGALVADEEDNTIWRASFTPHAGVQDPSNLIAVDMTGIHDLATNAGVGTTNSNNYAIDNVAPTFAMQYYSDSDLTNTVADNAKLKAGTYYIKITSSEDLGSTPTVKLAAEGSANDVTGGATTSISGNDYKYTRVIASDVLAVGTTLEEIKVTGTDSAGNVSTDADPTNEAAKEIYTDTVAPVVSAGTDAGTVSAQFTQNATVTDAGGIATYLWTQVSGRRTVVFGSADAQDTTVSVDGGGDYVIRLTATDLAGNSAYDDANFTWGSNSSGGGGGGSSSRESTTTKKPAATTTTTTTFPDVAGSHKNYTAVEYLYNRGIIKGYTDGQFKPDKTISRAEMTKIIVMAAGVAPTLEMYKNCFSDVKEEWFAPYVCYAKTNKLINGYTDGSFKPEKEITNAEYFKILMNVLGYGTTENVSANPFDDVMKDSWYAGFVAKAKELGVLADVEKMFAPGALVNRGMSVEYLYRVLKLKK